MKISIITPCFNSEKTIERTIESVVNQKGNFELEYIIIDGKSNDSTLGIIKKYSEKYKFIKYLSEKDNSMTEALNKGLNLCTGDIIGTLNADDEYLKDILKDVHRYFSEHLHYGIIVGNTFVINDDTKVEIYKATPRYINNYFLMCVLDCFTQESSVFYRKDVFDNFGQFNEKCKYTQDYELYLRLLKAGVLFKYVNQDFSKFYVSDNQYSVRAFKMMKEEVDTYIDYKNIHNGLKHFRINGFIRTLIKLREYSNSSKFFNHFLRRR